MICEIDEEADFTTLPAVVRQGIGQADPADVRPRDWQTISLALRDREGAVVGGLYGATMWSWLMIDGLWVAPGCRGQGLGRRLLLASEEIAISRGCIGSWLGTIIPNRRFHLLPDNTSALYGGGVTGNCC